MHLNGRNRRTLINYPTDIISRGNRFVGIIANLSREGLGLYIINPTPSHKKYCAPGSFVLLEFDLPTGNTIALECEIKWQRENRYQRSTMISMGMSIFAPPLNYIHFLESLNEILYFAWEETALTFN